VSGPAYARYGGNTSCVLVDMGDEPVIFDLGTGLRQLGHDLANHPRWGRRPLRATVLLTHLHYDHLLGLPFFGPIHAPEARLDVFGPDSVEGPLTEVMALAVRPPYFPVHLADFPGEFRLHPTGDHDFAVGPARVRARFIAHRGHTLGYRLEAGDHAVAYLPDHQAPLDRVTVPAGVRELGAGVDVLIHDAQYSEAEFDQKKDWGHSTVAYAVRVAAEVGAKQLVLFHHDPHHDDDTIDGLLAVARGRPEADQLTGICAASEGLSIELGPQ
jgi:ribonuclease BN (tRNA processing enzyme)